MQHYNSLGMGLLAVLPLSMSLASLPLTRIPVLAQPTPAAQSPYDDPFLTKAQNIARQTAINANGGLSQYRPENAMFGPSAKSPHTKNADGSITFTFKGGAPGASTPTLESVITVQSDGTSVITYNGPLRAAAPISEMPPMPTANPTTPPPQATLSSPNDDAFLTKAQNLARQAAIRVNGGLSAYRPESSMFGPANQAPFTRKPDGSITYTFKGGVPGATTSTVESVVTVMPDNIVVVEYNGKPR
jgi:hypothetical protein